MENYHTMFRKIIEEHKVIRGHIKLAGDSVSDRVAIDALRKARADWTPGRLEILSEKQKKLQQTLSFLDEGLQNHFALEARYLPPFLGELLMRALLLDHREIKKRIDEAKSVVTDTELEGLSQEELLSKEARMQQLVNALSRAVGEHAAREEILLRMLQKGLEDRGMTIS